MARWISTSKPPISGKMVAIAYVSTGVVSYGYVKSGVSSITRVRTSYDNGAITYEPYASPDPTMVWHDPQLQRIPNPDFWRHLTDAEEDQKVWLA